MYLYLVRHGAAVSEQEDPARPLTNEGAREAEAVGAFLAARWDFGAVQIWHSGKARAKQTAERIGALIAPGAALEQREGLTPNDDVDAALDALQHTRGDVMLVGHLPHLGLLAVHLLAGDVRREMVEFEKAAVLCLAHEAGEDWRLCWMVTPALAVER